MTFSAGKKFEKGQVGFKMAVERFSKFYVEFSLKKGFELLGRKAGGTCDGTFGSYKAHSPLDFLA